MARLLPEAVWKLAAARSTLPRFQSLEKQSQHAPARQAPSIANADNLSSPVSSVNWLLSDSQKLLTKILTMAMRANFHYDDTDMKAKRGCLTASRLSRGRGYQPKIDRRAPARKTEVASMFRALRNLGEAQALLRLPPPAPTRRSRWQELDVSFPHLSLANMCSVLRNPLPVRPILGDATRPPRSYLETVTGQLRQLGWDAIPLRAAP
ncbi:hypothetical protein E4U50_005746 [Claviceps purpurea]|nr:hypothetical protein E4U50_005746 [Claviceps purpurea]